MAAVFLVLWICQLILADHRGSVTVYTSDTETEQTNMDTPKEEIWKLIRLSGKNLTENKFNLTNTNERKMLTKENKIRKPFNVTDNRISDLGTIKERINNLEEDLEYLGQLYWQEMKEIRQDFKKFDAHLANLTRPVRALSDRRIRQFIFFYQIILNKTDAQKQQIDQLLTRINDLENNFKIHGILKPDISDFQKAMIAKDIASAAVYFNKIMYHNESINLIKDSYEAVNNFDCFMELAKLLDYDKQSQIYSEIQEVLLQKNESYADICHLGILWLKMKDSKHTINKIVLSEEDLIDDMVDDMFSSEDLYYEWIKVPNLAIITTNLSNRLKPLLKRNNHSDISLMVISKQYFDDQRLIYILPDSSERQLFYCEIDQLRLEEDNYVAPLDTC